MTVLVVAFEESKAYFALHAKQFGKKKKNSLLF